MSKSLQDNWRSRTFFRSPVDFFSVSESVFTSDFCDDTASWEHSWNSKAKLKNPVIAAVFRPEVLLPHVAKLPTFPHHEDFVVQHDVQRSHTTVSLDRCSHIMGSQMHFEVVFLLYSIKPDSTKFIFCSFPLGALDEHVFFCNRCEEGGDLRFARQSFPGTVFTHQQLTTNSWTIQASQDGNNLVFLLIVSKI